MVYLSNMPRYDYTCKACLETTVRHVSFEQRESAQSCECGSEAAYQFPLGAIKGFMPFEEYYDEALDCDIKGRSHRQSVMRALNVVEAGDKVGGARNFDKNAPDHIKPRPPRGIDFAPRIDKDPFTGLEAV